MDITNFANQLHKQISNSADLNEILILSKAIDSLNIGKVTIVSTFSDISSLSLIDGDLIFVDDETRLYFYAIVQGKVFIEPIFTFFESGIYSWGENSSGQLGINDHGSFSSRSSPVSIVGDFTDWISASAGSIHSLGVRANGTLWAWGSNTSGRLGDNTLTNRSSPVLVVGGFTDWISASAGTHSLGVRANGTLWAWGVNSSGQLGDDSTTSRFSPASVVGGFTDWIQASAGSGHNLGLRANGTIWTWGSNSNGRLGDDTTINRSSPVSVVGGFTDWIQASAGSSHSLGLRANGSLWAWGWNYIGRLGDNTLTSRSSPVSVVGGFTDWVQASAGWSHSLGVRANGTLWAWGSNYGKLGDNTITSRRSPVSVVGGFTDWISASAGLSHSLGLRANGSLWSWGTNNNGQLGTNNITNRSSPVSVVGGFTNWVQASAGDDNSFGVTIVKYTAVS